MPNKIKLIRPMTACSVKVITDNLVPFKETSKMDKLNFQTITNRMIWLYQNNQEFRDTIRNCTELKPMGC